MLSRAEVAHYSEHGFVIPDFTLDAKIVEDIKQRHARLLENHPEFTDYCPALLAFEPGFLEYARNPDLLDMVCQLIGDDIALWNSSFFAKPAKQGRKTPWHQDGQYWPIRPIATCSVWLALDAATRENGCLRFIPGSHRARTVAEHNVNDDPNLSLPLELAEDLFDEEDAVDVILEPGQISLHDVFLYHGSEANTSALPRRGMTLRYMPTSSVYRRDLARSTTGRLAMSERTLYLMRGGDVSGRNDFRIRY